MLKANRRQCLMGMISAAAFAPFSGCMSKTDAPIPDNPLKVDPDLTPLPPQNQLTPSMDCLAATKMQMDSVPWDTALTLGHFSNAAYSDAEVQASAIEKLGGMVIKPIAKGLSHCVVASNDHAIVIAFRGTNQAADWLTNVAITGRHMDGGKMHRGFYGAVDTIFDEVYAAMMSQGAKSKTLWITGHSLGGAMAAAFSYRVLIQKEKKVDGIITFGQPLVFSILLAQVMLDNFTTRYIRFVNNWDPVTRMLPNYRHAGSRVHLTDGLYEFQYPRIAVGAPDGVVAASGVIGFTEVAELEPMTEAEFYNFQQRLKAERMDANPSAVQVDRYIVGAVGAFVPLLTPHLMGTYLENLKSIGEKNINQDELRAVKTGL